MKNGTTKIIFRDFTSPVQSVIKSTKLEKLCRADILGYVIKVNMVEQPTPILTPLPLHPSIETILQKFQDTFLPKPNLPPFRPCDHAIPLKPGAKPPNIKPYRVPFTQKDEVSKLIQTMLTDSIIRPSTSPYASPAILVRKKDGSWCMCIDYRELNSQTVKDKFHIPVIEDLLDELHGAKVFTKLNLKNGYHQI
jgi:hypothetical protein